jgi:putative FmdB family regulatory protein
MPTYEYACSSCDSEFEELQKISDPPLDTCPKCNAKTVSRLISGGSFILKGGGWYADLYSSSGGSKSKGGSSESKSEGKSVAPAAASAAPAPAPAAPAAASSSSDKK